MGMLLEGVLQGFLAKKVSWKNENENRKEYCMTWATEESNDHIIKYDFLLS